MSRHLVAKTFHDSDRKFFTSLRPCSEFFYVSAVATCFEISHSEVLPVDFFETVRALPDPCVNQEDRRRRPSDSRRTSDFPRRHFGINRARTSRHAIFSGGSRSRLVSQFWRGRRSHSIQAGLPAAKRVPVSAKYFSRHHNGRNELPAAISGCGLWRRQFDRATRHEN